MTSRLFGCFTSLTLCGSVGIFKTLDHTNKTRARRPASLVFYERLHLVDQVPSHHQDLRDVVALGHFCRGNERMTLADRTCGRQQEVLFFTYKYTGGVIVLNFFYCATKSSWKMDATRLLYAMSVKSHDLGKRKQEGAAFKQMKWKNKIKNEKTNLRTLRILVFSNKISQ